MEIENVLGKKPNTWGIKTKPRGKGPYFNEPGFVEQPRQHQMEFNNKQPKSAIQIKTKVTLFRPQGCYLRRCLNSVFASVAEGR